jgi:isopentenyl-diphosphate delta-isomerase
MSKTEHGAAGQDVVSFESEKLILVNDRDEVIGSMSKAHAHDGDGVLHRAFSLFLFDTEGRLLLQRRSAEKRLWPLYWSNSCCSHPRFGESMEVATSRRLSQELGISGRLEFVYKFMYQARFSCEGSENEFCSVYLGRCAETPQVNETEIAEWRFISAENLERELEDRPEQFTPWFKMEWQRLSGEYADRLSAYTRKADVS